MTARIAGRVWTSDRRRTFVVGAYFDLHMNTADIADELSMAEAKVIAILDEFRGDEIANDQVRALAGPTLPLTDPLDGGRP